MHRGITRIIAAASSGLAVLALSGVTAAAATDTGWVPDGPYEPEMVNACGTTLTISDKINKVERRERVDDEGNVQEDFRGKYVVKVTAADGRKVVLDNSGKYSVFSYANGDTFVPVRSPALIYPFDPVERAAFKSAGLPAVFYYTRGRLELFISGDGQETVLKKPTNPVSICKLLR